jgi:hypothetical protein
VRMWAGFEYSERSNQALGSVRGKEFLDQLSDYHLLKKDSVSRNLYNIYLFQHWCLYQRK